MTDKKETLWDYQDLLPSVDDLDTVKLPIKIGDIQHGMVYKSPTPFRWSCWTRFWFTPNGVAIPDPFTY